MVYDEFFLLLIVFYVFDPSNIIIDFDLSYSTEALAIVEFTTERNITSQIAD